MHINTKAAAEALFALARGASITSVRRSRTQQGMLYRRYLAGRSKYPAAPPGHSMHEVGRAFDLKATDQELARLGSIWIAAGGTWSARDNIHFEA